MKNIGPPLPDNWVTTTLRTVRLDLSKSIDPRKSGAEMFELYSVPSFSDRRPDIVFGNTVGSSKRTVEPNSVLLCKINPRINRVWVVRDYSQHRKIASTEWLCFSELSGLFPDFLCYYLRQDSFREYLASNASGVGGSLMRVRDTTFADYPLPLPPLPEQHRIVAEIEKQFTRLDASVAALKRVQANLKRYRASVLKAACEGRLVPTEADLARAEGRDYEPADRLLERILAERRARWESQEKRRGKYKEPVAPDTTDLPELPEGWVWSRIGNIFEVYVGSTPRRARSDFWNGDIPWVSSGEVSFSRIKATRECITEAGLKNSSVTLHPKGTVLLGMIGEGKTRGQVSILDIPACNSQNSAAIRVSESELPPEYVFYYLWGQYDATRRIGSGNNQPALNKSRVQELLIPLPPLSEQHRIVADVERRLSVIQQTEAAVEANLTRAERLRQSILKRAFSGSLVPQDPNDEPASVLLERIRAEREAAEAAAKSQRKPRRRRSKSTGAARLKVSEAAQ